MEFVYMEFPVLSFIHLTLPVHLSLSFCFLKVYSFCGLQHLVSFEGDSSLAMLGFGLSLALSFLNTDKK